jgi:Outer membrane protein beta-barrel domain
MFLRIRQFLIVFLLILVASRALAQQSISGEVRPNKIKVKGKNLVGYDNRLTHYGFFVAINYSSFISKPSQLMVDRVKDRLANPETLGLAKPVIFGYTQVPMPSFTTGFVYNRRLGSHFDFRFNPTVSFYQRYLQFRYGRPNGDSTVNQLNQSVFSFIELPILFKYKSRRRNNTRMYIIGGIKPGFEVGAKKAEIDQRSLRTRTRDLSIEYGFGFDLYYTFFKFSPELRFSTGIANLKNNDNNDFALSLGRITTQTVTLYLNFE